MSSDDDDAGDMIYTSVGGKCCFSTPLPIFSFILMSFKTFLFRSVVLKTSVVSKLVLMSGMWLIHHHNMVRFPSSLLKISSFYTRNICSILGRLVHKDIYNDGKPSF